MILSKKEKLMMNAVYSIAAPKGQCLATGVELLSLIPYKNDFREEDVEKTLEALKVEGYFEYDKASRKNETVYCIVLREKGLSYERDKQKSRRKLIFRLALTVICALLGWAVKEIISAIIA